MIIIYTRTLAGEYEKAAESYYKAGAMELEENTESEETTEKRPVIFTKLMFSQASQDFFIKVEQKN
jgi:hypothetical protein